MLILILISLLVCPGLRYLFGLPLAVIPGVSIAAAVPRAYRFLLGMSHFVVPKGDVLASASASV